MTDKLKRSLIWLPAKLYELLVRLRIAAYETDYLKSKRLDATVISIGNLTLGGTGKTPIVEYFARYLSDEGQTVAVLSRGYGRKSNGLRAVHPNQALGSDASGEYGDEPAMMARLLPQVPVVISANRYEGGLFAQREFGADVLILDDGFQHLALSRDLNILLIDATNPFGGFEMVPLGRLREPLYAIKRADAIIITRAHRGFDQAQVLGIIKYFCGDRIPIMYAYTAITSFRHLTSNETYEADQFRGWKAAVLCGIGNPTAFADDVLQPGIDIVAEHFFRDHYEFAQDDISEVERSARAAGADFIVTTEKDAVRLEGLKLGEIPVYAARAEIESDDEVRLKSLLLRTVHGRRSLDVKED